jgi:hypothetical protein
MTPDPMGWVTDLLSLQLVRWSDLDVADTSRVLTTGVAAWATAVTEVATLQMDTLMQLAAPWTALPTGGAAATGPAKDTPFAGETWTGNVAVQQVTTTPVSAQCIDGLRGSGVSECVEFALDGLGYEIDLSSEDAARLRAILAPFVAAAERASGGHRRGALTGQREGPASRSRTWARNGRQALVRDRCEKAGTTAPQSPPAPRPGDPAQRTQRRVRH